MTLCKLTDQDMQTHGGCQWVLGEWKEVSGKGGLCTDGWLHGYTDPLLAVFLNPIHANIKNPRLWRIEVDGARLDDHGLKFGVQRMRLVEELPLPVVTTEQRVRFTILCAYPTASDGWQTWAAGWLSGRNRSASASAAAAAVKAAAASAAASAWAAAEAARAATWAASASASASASAAEAEWAAAEAEWAAAEAARAAAEAAVDLDLIAIAHEAVQP